MRFSLCPGINQIGSRDMRIVLQKLGFPDAKLLRFAQEPNGNAGSGNTGVPTANTGRFGDALAAHAQGFGQTLNNLGLVRQRETEKLLLKFLAASPRIPNPGSKSTSLAM